MASFTPIDHDPFAAPATQGDVGSGPLIVTVAPNRRGRQGFVPVDHDPFADQAPANTAGPQVALTEDDTARLEAQMPPVQTEQPSQLRSGLLGALQGSMFNFGDEVGSGINAGIDYVTGQAPDGIAAAYDARLTDARRQLAEAEQANPGTFLTGQIGGGILTAPLTPAKAGIAGGALTGAAYGALSGAGAGQGIGDRLTGAAVGGVVGGGVGAAVPAAIGGAKTLYNRGMDAAANATGTVRGMVNADAEAARRVQAALARDAQIGGTQFDDASLAAAQRAGQPVRVADIGGETTRALARSAANTSPEGRAALQATAEDRFQTQGNRAVEFVQRLAGTTGDAGATREALQAAAKAANRGAYGRAYAQGRSGLWDDTLSRLSAAPAVQSEIRDATRRSANKAASQGFGPVQNPFVTAADGTVSLKPGTTPSLQFWDVVKQGLDDQIEALGRAGAKGERGDLIALRNALREHLDRLVPSYSAARRGAATAFDAEDALEAGEKFVSSSMSNHDARRALAKMSAPERKLFADGFASSLIEQINRTGDRRNVINKIWGTRSARERIEIALGKDKSRELEAFVNVESVMDRLRTAVSGNSTTARQLVELGLAGAGGAYTAGSGDPRGMAYGLLIAGLSRGQRAIDARVAKRVADMLVSDDPAKVRQAAQTLAKNPTLLEAVKSADDFFVKAIGPASNENVARPLELTVRPYVGMRSSSAAEEDQNQRP